MTLATITQPVQAFRGGYPLLDALPSDSEWFSDDCFDHGLEHNHHWARDGRTDGSMAGRDRHPVVADASSIPTTSTAVHDDSHHWA